MEKHPSSWRRLRAGQRDGRSHSKAAGNRCCTWQGRPRRCQRCRQRLARWRLLLLRLLHSVLLLRLLAVLRLHGRLLRSRDGHARGPDLLHLHRLLLHLPHLSLRLLLLLGGHRLLLWRHWPRGPVQLLAEIGLRKRLCIDTGRFPGQLRRHVLVQSVNTVSWHAGSCNPFGNTSTSIHSTMTGMPRFAA